MNDGRGSIILNSSIAGVKGFPGTTVYSASKASDPFFCPNLDCRVQRKDQSQCHQSRTIDTAIFDGAPQEMKNSFVSIIPMGRMGNPDEIASVCDCLSRQMILVSLRASSCSSMAAQHRSN